MMALTLFARELPYRKLINSTMEYGIFTTDGRSAVPLIRHTQVGNTMGYFSFPQSTHLNPRASRFVSTSTSLSTPTHKSLQDVYAEWTVSAGQKDLFFHVRFSSRDCELV